MAALSELRGEHLARYHYRTGRAIACNDHERVLCRIKVSGSSSTTIRQRSTQLTTRPSMRRRGYAWSPGEFGRPKCWYRDVSDRDRAAEVSWLRENVMRPERTVWAVRITARDRYSDRCWAWGEREQIPRSCGAGPWRPCLPLIKYLKPFQDPRALSFLHALAQR